MNNQRKKKYFTKFQNPGWGKGPALLNSDPGVEGGGRSALSYLIWLRPWYHYVANNFNRLYIFCYMSFRKRSSRANYTFLSSYFAEFWRPTQFNGAHEESRNVIGCTYMSEVCGGAPQSSKWHHRAIRYFAVFAQRARPCFDKSCDFTSMERFSILL